jgi:hypothetical protein
MLECVIGVNDSSCLEANPSDIVQMDSRSYEPCEAITPTIKSAALFPTIYGHANVSVNSGNSYGQEDGLDCRLASVSSDGSDGRYGAHTRGR